MKRFVSVTAWLIHNNYQSANGGQNLRQTPSKVVGERICQNDWKKLRHQGGPQQAWDTEPMLCWCCASVADVGSTAAQHWFNVSCLQGRLCLKRLLIRSLIRGRAPSKDGTLSIVLVQCWPIVSDAGPTLKQHKGNVTCLLGGAHGANRSVTIHWARWGVTDLIVCIHLRLTPSLNNVL